MTEAQSDTGQETAERSANGAGQRIIAIDGPAGAGKSSIARAVAERSGIPYLDTGAMYRAITWAVLEAGLDPDDGGGVAERCEQLDIAIEPGLVTVDGIDVTSAIREHRVSTSVSAVAAVPAVRDRLVRMQRDWAAQHGGAVVEGRDIGTVVFPTAGLKIFLTASPLERARRRHLETDDERSLEQIAADIERRDHLDSTREHSPLKPADDAVWLDTSDLSIDQVIDRVLDLAAAAYSA